jgi:CheY-like chemotaxis protein
MLCIKQSRRVDMLPLEGKRIFIVEDNLANRAVAQLLLEQAGAKIAFERWGTETVNKLRLFRPVDIILLDLMFPNGITGYSVFNDIRACSEFQHIPILAVSASDPSSAIPQTRIHGFSGYISKPVDFDFFAQQVADVINGQAVWQGRS